MPRTEKELELDEEAKSAVWYIYNNAQSSSADYKLPWTPSLPIVNPKACATFFQDHASDEQISGVPKAAKRFPLSNMLESSFTNVGPDQHEETFEQFPGYRHTWGELSPGVPQTNDDSLHRIFGTEDPHASDWEERFRLYQWLADRMHIARSEIEQIFEVEQDTAELFRLLPWLFRKLLRLPLSMVTPESQAELSALFGKNQHPEFLALCHMSPTLSWTESSACVTSRCDGAAVWSTSGNKPLTTVMTGLEYTSRDKGFPKDVKAFVEDHFSTGITSNVHANCGKARCRGSDRSDVRVVVDRLPPILAVRFMKDPDFCDNDPINVTMNQSTVKRMRYIVVDYVKAGSRTLCHAEYELCGHIHKATVRRKATIPQAVWYPKGADLKNSFQYPFPVKPKGSNTEPICFLAQSPPACIDLASAVMFWRLKGGAQAIIGHVVPGGTAFLCCEEFDASKSDQRSGVKQHISNPHSESDDSSSDEA